MTSCGPRFSKTPPGVEEGRGKSRGRTKREGEQGYEHERRESKSEKEKCEEKENAKRKSVEEKMFDEDVSRTGSREKGNKGQEKKTSETCGGEVGL